MIRFTVTKDIFTHTTALRTEKHIHSSVHIGFLTRTYSLRIVQAQRNKRVKISTCSCILQMVHVFINRPLCRMVQVPDVWQEIVERMGLVLKVLKIFFRQVLLLWLNVG